MEHLPDEEAYPSAPHEPHLSGNMGGKCESYIGSFADPHRVFMEGLSRLFIAHAA